MPYIGQSPTQVAFVTDTFSGNGSTTAFTMSVAPAGTASVLVAVSGVLQDPTTYSVSGLTLTFSAAPPTGTGNISCRYLGIPASGITTTAYRTVTEFTATASQTTFTPPSYTAGFINVYRNGVLLGSADYTATNGITVVLATGATAGDLVTVESFLVSSVLNAIPATTGSVGTTYLANASVTQAKLGSIYQNSGPVFSAYLGTAQTLSGSTTTKIALLTKEYDTNGCYNNTGSTVTLNGISVPSYSFAPNVAGYYQIQGGIAVVSTATGMNVYIYKNGAIAKVLFNLPGANCSCGYGSAVVYLNGTSDYISLYATVVSGQNIDPASQNTYFQASLLRAA